MLGGGWQIHSVESGGFVRLQFINDGEVDRVCYELPGDFAKAVDPWLCFIESARRIWVYDGDDQLCLLECDESGLTVSTLEAMGDSLLAQVPPRLSERMPGVFGVVH